MTLELHPRISRVRRQSAIEQTSDLLRAYLEHGQNPFECDDASGESDQSNGANRPERPDLTAGFLLPQRKFA